jgi:hypothetical protein
VAHMLTRCPYCGASLHQAEANSAQSPAKCWMCTAPLPADDSPRPRSKVSNATVVIRPLEAGRRSGALRLDESSTPHTKTLVLPQNEVIRLHVLEGTHPGARFDLSKPLMTIGRIGGGADIEIEDPEVSRLHCSIEVRRDAILLQDMHSKNGTFMGDARVFTARLRADSEFRIGATVLRVDRVAI